MKKCGIILTYNYNNRKCYLSLIEKIALYERENLLNKKTEFICKSRHQNKFMS